MSFSSSISSFDEQSDGHLLSLIDVSLHCHLCLLTLVLSFVCLQFKRDFTGQLFRSMKRFIDYVVFSPCESNFPASARRYWRRIDVGICPVQFSGVCHPPVKGVCVLQFLKPLTPRIKGLQRCNDTMKECRILRKGLICTYSIFIYGWRIGVRHIFFRISGRSISNAIGKIIFMAYLEVRLRFGLFSRTLLRTNWHQVVAISKLSDVMGFTDMIRRQPQVKERHKNRIGVKEAEKYYKYVYLLACLEKMCYVSLKMDSCRTISLLFILVLSPSILDLLVSLLALSRNKTLFFPGSCLLIVMMFCCVFISCLEQLDFRLLVLVQ